jgi:hypothetical protein
MQYFRTIPKIVYYNPITNNPIIVTDLLARASVIPTIFNDPLLFYQYDVQEGDTPETVAFKYYGDAYRYWIVLFSNQALDPQWNWPLSYEQFNAYIADKYQEFDPYATVYEYQQIITQYDHSTQLTTVNTITISQAEYNILPTDPITQSYTLPTGLVDVTKSKNALSYYDWELSVNESKRSINLINVNYVDEVEKEFKKLMKS